MRDFAKDWMWSEAVEMLARAERLHRDFFRPTALPTWEPPADVLEMEHEILIVVALPGVPATSIEAGIEGDYLTIMGTRMLPPELRTATIHRLEIPQGRFQRRIPLPSGRYSAVHRAVADGCLLIKLEKVQHGR